MKQFQDTGCLCKNKRTGRKETKHEVVERIRDSFLRSPSKSTRRAGAELTVPHTTVWRVLQKRFQFKPYRYQMVQALKPTDKPLHKLHKLEDSNLEKVYKLVKLEKKYEILQETFKITKKRLEKEIECTSLTEKILIVNALRESNDHPKTSMSTKEREINPSKRKTKKLKSSGRKANQTSDSDENQALAKEKNDLCRQIDFLNSIILDTKLKEPNKSSTAFQIFFRCGQLTCRIADCEVDGTTRYCKPPLGFQVASKGSKRAITAAEEAAREKVKNASEADAQRQSSNHS
ncbi:uncharacterized protein TNCV_2777071 [Trichonephila clavipes]|nr:uncharacterized protein TNCV_2777071 [Trichonephila clavipes]